MPRKLTKEEAQRIAKLRHSKMTKEQKSLHAVKMNDARWRKKKYFTLPPNADIPTNL